MPSPSAAHGGIPPTLETIDRKALAPNPEERFASAAEMAEALESFLGEERGADGLRAAGVAGVAGAAVAGAAGAKGAAGGTAAGAGAAGAGAAGAAAGGAAVGSAAGAASSPTVAAGVARPNPGARIDYPREAYADAAPVGARSRRAGGRGAPARPAQDEDEQSGGGPWLWIAALVAVGVLALAAFFLFNALGAGPQQSQAPQVQVPNLIGKTFAQASQAAADVGLTVEQSAFEQSSATLGTVISQVPPEGSTVDAGSKVLLTMAISPQLTIQRIPQPDLRQLA